MQRIVSLAASTGLLVATSSTFAQPVEGPELTITFSPLNAVVSATAVPVGPLAVWLSILAIGAVMAYASKKGKKHWLSLPAVAALVGIGLSQPASTEADMIPPTTVTLTSSPTRLTLPTFFSFPVSVTNSNSFPIRLNSVSLAPNDRHSLIPYTPEESQPPVCEKDTVLTANGICSVYISVPN